ncbi:DUF4291 domain-containing protein [bacterium]|nr:MAG: DUF4291 domain-containing protein [bacterium]
MKLITELYREQLKTWPWQGRHIMAQFDAESIVVYQAYNPAIGHFAARHGYFGGEFRPTRMSWIKPNFLWMMYRSGWGTKPNQEVTLAVRIKLSLWEDILAQAVVSSFNAEDFEDNNAWRKAVEDSEVRLQWDPDHDPYGQKSQRRAIQLGLRGEMLQRYIRDEVLEIKDISSWVEIQRQYVLTHQLDRLDLPSERVYKPSSQTTIEKLRLDQFFDEDVQNL